MKKRILRRKSIPFPLSYDLKMKLTTLFLIVSLFQIHANPSYGQNTKVTLNLQNVSLEKVLNRIETLTDYKFVYKDKEVNYQKTVTVSVAKRALSKVLDNLLSDTNIGYTIYGKQIVLRTKSKSQSSLLQMPVNIRQTQFQIGGTVLDENDSPLPGASIVEKGTTNGTTADFDGNFSILVSDSNAALVVSYLGYKSQEIMVNGKSTINVRLEPDTAALDEVVVIGYGEQSKVKVTGAVGEMDGESLGAVAAASVDQQLAGKMSGVVVNQSNGQPGADSQIVIRGIGTLTAGTNPLIVVDGFPLTEGSSLSAINPNDIADINILKDAASASIYGSRAANGVVLVTTKQGKNNQKTKVSLDMYGGIQQQSSGVDLVNAYQFAQFLTEARNWGYVSKDPLNRNENDPNSVRVTKQINGQGIDGRELNLDYLQPYLDGTPGLVDTNWIDEAFRSAPISNYTLSISGGDEKTKFYTSLGYFDQEGIILGTDLKRYSAAISLETKINDRLSFGFNVKPSYTNQNSSDQASRSSGALGLISLDFPFYTPYKADGSLNISDQLVNEQRVIEGVRINGTPVENLVATTTKVKDNTLRFRAFGNIYLNAELLKGLTYRLSLGGDYDSYTRNYYYPSDVGSYRTPAPRSDANSDQYKQNKVNFLIENTLNYKLDLNKHNFNILAGYTFQKENLDYTHVTGTGFPDDNIQSIAGASAYTVSASLNIWTLESYLSRLQYDYDAKYLFSAAIRRDGSSRFGANNRWGNFPSVSAGWVLSREDFFPKTNLLTFAKLSASWGQTGNNQIGTYGSQALVTDSNYVFGNTIAPGYITTTPPNPDLGWEVASSLNVGLDLGLIHDKLNLSMAYYKTNTKDLLLDVPVPQQTGYNTVLANIGEMENQGLEFQLSGDNFMVGQVGIGFNANLTSYKNKVLALGPGQDQIATGSDQNFVTKIGGPIAEIYGYDVTGIYKTQSEIDNSPHLNGTLTGDYIVEDVNNDGIINVDDKIAKGSYAPNLTYGIGSNISYKGFTFNFNFSGVAGRTLLDNNLSHLTEAGEGFGVPTTYYFNNRYHPVDNPNGFLGQPNFGNFSNSRKQVRSSIVVQENNGDYFRLRDVRLAYDFPNQLLEKAKLSDLQIYLSGNNVFTKTNFRGWNPDGTSDNILTSGFNNGSNYPIAKTFLLGLKITY